MSFPCMALGLTLRERVRSPDIQGRARTEPPPAEVVQASNRDASWTPGGDHGADPERFGILQEELKDVAREMDGKNPTLESKCCVFVLHIAALMKSEALETHCPARKNIYMALAVGKSQSHTVSPVLQI